MISLQKIRLIRALKHQGRAGLKVAGKKRKTIQILIVKKSQFGTVNKYFGRFGRESNQERSVDVLTIDLPSSLCASPF